MNARIAITITITITITIGLLSALPALAQHHAAHGPAAGSHAAHSGYAPWKDRAIKALSEQQVADLRAGKGMALALPAELNGYPGPLHALELAGPLGLSEAQKQATQTLFAQMQEEARLLGEQVIASERELDQLFKDGTADAESVHKASASAARSMGALRAAHLRFHLSMRDVLTPTQVARYNTLRGYD